jgi:hypothetical protein
VHASTKLMLSLSSMMLSCMFNASAQLHIRIQENNNERVVHATTKINQCATDLSSVLDVGRNGWVCTLL